MKIEVIEIITQLLFYSPNFLTPKAFRFIHSKSQISHIDKKYFPLFFILRVH